MITKKVHISEIKSGDAIIHNEKVVTVNQEYIKHGFCGITLFGDSYKMNTQPVTKLI